MSSQDVRIRPAEKKDCSKIVGLIQELADFEKMSDGPKLTEKDLIRDGFDTKPPLFRCLLAESNNRAVGYSIFYYIYSTWRGKCMYLEDLYVTPEFRNKKVGVRLFNAVVELGVKEGCGRLDFECLGWNPALEFYKKQGAVNVTVAEDWQKHHMDRQTMDKIVEKINKSNKK